MAFGPETGLEAAWSSSRRATLTRNARERDLLLARAADCV